MKQSTRDVLYLWGLVFSLGLFVKENFGWMDQTNNNIPEHLVLLKRGTQMRWKKF